jgi:branched-chain amino acid transport system permease protein
MGFLTEIVQQIIFGTVMGCIYALVAICMVLLYKGTGILNFAQGEMVVFSTFIAYTLRTGFQLPYWLVFILSFVISWFFGMLIEVLAFRRVFGKPHLNTLMVAIAIGMILRNATGQIWTFDDLRMPPPFSDQVFQLPFGLVISPIFIGIISISFLIMIILYFFMNRTRLGLSIRATSQNPTAAMLMGVPVSYVFSMCWAISAAIGSVAGILIAPLLVLNVGMFIVVLKAIVAAVLGGIESLPGAVLGGILLGVLENLIGTYLPSWIREIFVWVVLLGVIIAIPQGLWGVRKHSRV